MWRAQKNNELSTCNEHTDILCFEVELLEPEHLLPSIFALKMK